MTQARTHKGCNIYPMGRNNWEAYVNGVFIAAETLAGIKQFITDQLEQDSRMGAH